MRKTRRAPRIAVLRHNQYPGEAHLRRDVLALRDAGFEVDVICNRAPGRPSYERMDGVTVLRVPILHKRGGIVRYVFEYVAFPILAAVILALRSLRRRYAYVEADNPPDWLIIAALLPKLLGARIVLYLFENLPELYATDHQRPPTDPVVRGFAYAEAVCARAADRVIVPYQQARQRLIARGVDGRKMTVVPNVPDELYYLVRGAAVQPDTRADEHGLRLVTHGSLLERYGVQTLLEAAALVRCQVPGLHVEIMGDGEYRASLEALARQLDLGDIVSFSGYVPDEELVPRIVRADVGVVPMWVDYAVPNKLMEYLALGLPVIASDLTVLREEGLTDAAVLFVEPRNPQALAAAILTLHSSAQARLALAAEGHRLFREKYAWAQRKHDYLAVYGVGEKASGFRRRGAQ